LTFVRYVCDQSWSQVSDHGSLGQWVSSFGLVGSCRVGSWGHSVRLVLWPSFDFQYAHLS